MSCPPLVEVYTNLCFDEKGPFIVGIPEDCLVEVFYFTGVFDKVLMFNQGRDSPPETSPGRAEFIRGCTESSVSTTVILEPGGIHVFNRVAQLSLGGRGERVFVVRKSGME